MTNNGITKKEPLWTKDFILVFISNFLLFLGFYLLLSTLPFYIFEKGGDNADVGLITAVLIISAILIRPISGIALETVNKKIFLSIGILICIISIGSFNWATLVLSIMVIRFIHGFGWGISTTTYGTIAADLIPKSRRGEGMGFFTLAGTIAMSLGPPLGIFIVNNKGFSNLFLTATVSSTLALILLLFVSVPQVEEVEDKKKESILSRLIERKALIPSFLALLLGFTYGGITSFITLFGKEVGIENVGWFFTINAIFMLIVRFFSGKIYDKKGHIWVLLPGAILTFLGVVILSYVKSISTLIIAAIIYGLGFGSVQPSLQTWAVNRAIPSRRGAANATFYSAFDLGIGAGSIVLSFIAEALNYAKMYRISSISIIVFIVFYLMYVYKEKSN